MLGKNAVVYRQVELSLVDHQNARAGRSERAWQKATNSIPAAFE